MRYHYEKPDIYNPLYGEIYICNHPVYDRCTLFKIHNNGLAVIQQRFNPVSKTTRWTEIDPWLVNDLYLHEKFKEYFDSRAEKATDGLYPTRVKNIPLYESYCLLLIFIISKGEKEMKRDMNIAEVIMLLGTEVTGQFVKNDGRLSVEETEAVEATIKLLIDMLEISHSNAKFDMLKG